MIALKAVTPAIQAMIDPVTLALQAALDAITLAVQTALDAVALPVEVPGQPVIPARGRMLGGAVQVTVDALAPVVQAFVDALALAIQMPFDAVALVIQIPVNPLAVGMRLRSSDTGAQQSGEEYRNQSRFVHGRSSLLWLDSARFAPLNLFNAPAGRRLTGGREKKQVH